MNILTIVLRFVHIFAGIFWAGAALLMSFFIGPAIAAAGDAGKNFSRYLILKTRFSMAMSAAAGLTVLAGAILYLKDSDWFSSAWVTSSAGIGFGLGAISGIVAFIFGAMFGKLSTQLAKAGEQIQGKPTPEQLAQIAAIQKKMATVTPIHTVAMILAVILMGIARYL